MIEANQPVEIVDVRPRRDFEKKHAAGSHSLPFNEFTREALAHSRELPESEPLYLISANDERAQIVADQMDEYGTGEGIVVEGGMEAWDLNGLPVERNHRAMNWLLHRRRMVDNGLMTELCDVH